jgi:hypothetical protein
MSSRRLKNAEKIIELGKNIPAAAMISGSAEIQGRLVSSFLKDAAQTVDADHAYQNAQGVIDKVIATIDPPYLRLLDAVREQYAAFRSQTDQLAEINERRQDQGLPPLTSVRPDQIAIRGELDPPPDPLEIVDLQPLTIVVCSYFEGRPRATEIVWPGARMRECVPGSPLWWWGSGGSAVAGSCAVSISICSKPMRPPTQILAVPRQR